MTDVQLTILQKLEQIEGMLTRIGRQPRRIDGAANAIHANGTDSSFESLLITDDVRTSSQPSRHVSRPAFPARGRIEEELRHRKDLCELFGPDLVADPVWTMILELLLAASQHKRVSVTSLCVASGIAQTTALRWIGNMEAKDIVQREPDRVDRRRVFIELTPNAMTKVARFLERHGRISPL